MEIERSVEDPEILSGWRVGGLKNIFLKTSENALNKRICGYVLVILICFIVVVLFQKNDK